MSERIDQFCENLRVQLTNVESHLTKVGESIKAAPQEAQAAIRAKIDGAKAQHEQNMQKIADSRATLEERVQEKKAEIDTQIQEWKTNREISKLEHRATKLKATRSRRSNLQPQPPQRPTWPLLKLFSCLLLGRCHHSSVKCTN